MASVSHIFVELLSSSSVSLKLSILTVDILSHKNQMQYVHVVLHLIFQIWIVNTGRQKVTVDPRQTARCCLGSVGFQKSILTAGCVQSFSQKVFLWEMMQNRIVGLNSFDVKWIVCKILTRVNYLWSVKGFIACLCYLAWWFLCCLNILLLRRTTCWVGLSSLVSQGESTPEPKAYSEEVCHENGLSHSLSDSDTEHLSSSLEAEHR